MNLPVEVELEKTSSKQGAIEFTNSRWLNGDKHRYFTVKLMLNQNMKESKKFKEYMKQFESVTVRLGESTSAP